MQVIDCEQGTPEWFEARMGIPTASMFETIMAKKGPRGGEPAIYKGRKTYMMKLAGEILTGKPMETGGSRATERGHIMEPEARDTYAFMQDVDTVAVGFIRNGRAGASPDSLVGDDGVLEIKTKAPQFQIETLLNDEIPKEHLAQCQGQILISEREWCDFVSYWPGLPLFVKRVYRHDEYLKNLSESIDVFNEELAAMVEKVKGL